MAKLSSHRYWNMLVLTLLSGLGCRSMECQSWCSQSPSCAWSGIYPTVVTPFDCQGVDVASLEKQIQYALDNGVHGLLVLGTVGEGQYVRNEERAQVIITAVKEAQGRVPVIVGIHTCSLENAQAQLGQAKELGASAVLIKYVGRSGARGPEVLDFIGRLAELNVLPIFYYHYPSQTGVRLRSREIAEILSLPNVVGIKESTLDLRNVQKHIALARGQGKAFFSGTALNLTQFMKLGGQGAMCPEAVLLPGTATQAYNAWQAGNARQARALQEDLFAMTPILTSRGVPLMASRQVFMTLQDMKTALPLPHGNPQARLKCALDRWGIPTSAKVKSPLRQLRPREKLLVNRTVDKLKRRGCRQCRHDSCPALDIGGSQVQAGLILKTGAGPLGSAGGNNTSGFFGDGHWGLANGK